jgi:hypothetical protein
MHHRSRSVGSHQIVDQAERDGNRRQRVCLSALSICGLSGLAMIETLPTATARSDLSFSAVALAACRQEIVGQSRNIWGEHCLECACPHCYRACGFCTPPRGSALPTFRGWYADRRRHWRLPPESSPISSPGQARASQGNPRSSHWRASRGCTPRMLVTPAHSRHRSAAILLPTPTSPCSPARSPSKPSER